MVKKNIALKNLKSQVAEQFRSLRTNIEFPSSGDALKSIVVTSSLHGEGKSTIVSNLAVAMANSGKRTIIVDCDLRNPTIHNRFSLSNYRGLTDILAKDRKINEVIKSTDVNNLYVIPAGALMPNSIELLDSNNMKEILNELTNSFDIVLIDTPAISQISDAQILSALSHGTIIVTAYEKSEKNTLLNTKEKIEKVGGKILGVVINKIPN